VPSIQDLIINYICSSRLFACNQLNSEQAKDERNIEVDADNVIRRFLGELTVLSRSSEEPILDEEVGLKCLKRSEETNMKHETKCQRSPLLQAD
jgi:hypothetical protein